MLIAVDPFSKWVELWPMKSKHSGKVWGVLFNQLICRFGLPVEFRCDRGREFFGMFSIKC